MVIFHSYVKLPEGILIINIGFSDYSHVEYNPEIPGLLMMRKKTQICMGISTGGSYVGGVQTVVLMET